MEHPELLQAHRSRRHKINAGYVIACAIFAVLLIMIAASTAHAGTYQELQERYSRVEVGIAPPESNNSNMLNVLETVETASNNMEIVENPYQTIPISDAEFEELRWVLALEAQGEGLEGEIAVCEAIFNRVLSTSNWGSGVHGVLSRRGQFSTYKLIGSRKAWARPGELEDDAISECLRRGPSVLPSMKYVYFDSKGGVNGRNKVRIGHHTFGAEK